MPRALGDAHVVDGAEAGADLPAEAEAEAQGLEAAAGTLVAAAPAPDQLAAAPAPDQLAVAEPCVPNLVEKLLTRVRTQRRKILKNRRQQECICHRFIQILGPSKNCNVP